MQTVDGGGVSAKNVSAANGSFDLALGQFSVATIDAALTALAGGTTPTVAFTAQRLDSAGNPVGAATSFGTALSAPGSQTLTVGVGSGTAALNHLFDRLRIAWVTTGGPTTATANIGVMGKISN